LILLSHSLLAQYPIKRIFKGDSVVIMKVSQADTINLLYKNYNDTINDLKNSIKIKKLTVDSLNIEISDLNIKKENYKIRYEERLKMPTKYQYHDDGWDFAQKLVLVGVIVLQFFTIKR